MPSRKAYPLQMRSIWPTEMDLEALHHLLHHLHLHQPLLLIILAQVEAVCLSAVKARPRRVQLSKMHTSAHPKQPFQQGHQE